MSVKTHLSTNLFHPSLLGPTWTAFKEADLYSAFIEIPYTLGAQVRITVLPANYTVPASTS